MLASMSLLILPDSKKPANCFSLNKFLSKAFLALFAKDVLKDIIFSE
jgi:hypothetical protein